MSPDTPAWLLPLCRASNPNQPVGIAAVPLGSSAARDLLLDVLERRATTAVDVRYELAPFWTQWSHDDPRTAGSLVEGVMRRGFLRIRPLGNLPERLRQSTARTRIEQRERISWLLGDGEYTLPAGTLDADSLAWTWAATCPDDELPHVLDVAAEHALHATAHALLTGSLRWQERTRLVPAVAQPTMTRLLATENHHVRSAALLVLSHMDRPGRSR